MVVSSCTAEIILKRERERGEGGGARPVGGEGNGGERVVWVGGAGALENKLDGEYDDDVESTFYFYF